MELHGSGESPDLENSFSLYQTTLRFKNRTKKKHMTLNTVVEIFKTSYIIVMLYVSFQAGHLLNSFKLICFIPA